jgi:hypothetical protein
MVDSSIIIKSLMMEDHGSQSHDHSYWDKITSTSTLEPVDLPKTKSVMLPLDTDLDL